MTTALWAVFIGVALIVLVIIVVVSGRRRVGGAMKEADTANLARRALADIDHNRRELVHPTETTRLALRLEAVEELLTSAEFAERVSMEALQRLQAYRTFVKAVGESAMVQRTGVGEPLVMSRLLSEEGGRDKYERLSREAEDALQEAFETKD